MTRPFELLPSTPLRRRPKATFSKIGQVREERVALEHGVHVPLVRRESDDVLVPEVDRPSLGSSKPPIIRSVVVFPQPDGPSSAKNVPRANSRERSSTATTSSKSLRDVLDRDVGGVRWRR